MGFCEGRLVGYFEGVLVGLAVVGDEVNCFVSEHALLSFPSGSQMKLVFNDGSLGQVILKNLHTVLPSHDI